MRLGGFQKLTLLDFPEHIACTVFTVGCNFRCPFCHNAPLIHPIPEEELLDEEEFFSFLSRRKGILDGVAITGGEPLLHPDIGDFIRRIRDLGFLVKLDTNGSNPSLLKKLAEDGLLDYVAMDIKNDPAHLKETIGTDRFAGEIEESMRFLMNGKTPFEFRTTAVHELHRPENFAAIGQMIRGTERYFIQRFTDSGNILSEGMTAPSDEEMESFRQAVLPYVPAARLRGVE